MATRRYSGNYVCNGEQIGAFDMAYHEIKSLSFFERKEYEELKNRVSEAARRKRERAVFLGFFVISLVATLLISGAL